MVTKPTKDVVVAEEVEPEKPKLKRRDLLEVSALLRRNKLDPTDPAAMGLGLEFLTEKKAGETNLPFREWLDEDIPDDDEDEDDDSQDPTLD